MADQAGAAASRSRNRRLQEEEIAPGARTLESRPPHAWFTPTARCKLAGTYGRRIDDVSSGVDVKTTASQVISRCGAFRARLDPYRA